MYKRIKGRVKHNIFNMLLKISPVFRKMQQTLNQIHIMEKGRIIDSYNLLFKISSNDFSLNKSNRDKELIVTLTTTPNRINKVYLTIESIFQQSILPDKIVLNVDKLHLNEDNLPNNLKKQILKGLEVNYVDDIGPFTKLLPTMKKYENGVFVTADDDIIYPSEWLRILYNNHIEDPNSIHCFRGHIIKYKKNKLFKYNDWLWENTDFELNKRFQNNIFPTGVGGVIYSKNHFNNELYKEENFLKLCPKADDIWFKAMSLLNNTKSKIIKQHISLNTPPFINSMIIIDSLQEYSLSKKNVKQEYNDIQMNSVFSKYDLYNKLDRF